MGQLERAREPHEDDQHDGSSTLPWAALPGCYTARDEMFGDERSEGRLRESAMIVERADAQRTVSRSRLSPLADLKVARPLSRDEQRTLRALVRVFDGL